MILGKTGIFIRQEHTNKGVVNHQFAGTVLDKYRSHEKIETKSGFEFIPVDYYLVQLQGGKLDGVITSFHPDELNVIQDSPSIDGENNQRKVLMP